MDFLILVLIVILLSPFGKQKRGDNTQIRKKNGRFG